MNFVLFSSFLAYCELLLRIFVVFGKIYKWQRRESEKSLVSCFVSPPKIGIYSPKFELRVELHTAHCACHARTFAEIQTYLETSSKISVQKIITTWVIPQCSVILVLK